MSTTFLRRALDIAVAGGLLLVMLPVLIAIAIAIRAESGGPVIFRQRRLGRELRGFTVLKFRTMRPDADVTPHREYVKTLIEGATNGSTAVNGSAIAVNGSAALNGTPAVNGSAGAANGSASANANGSASANGAPGVNGGHLYKLSVDDRVTRVGRFLRSWSLDELPQLVNVLRGDMALVGPRPVIPYEAEMYPKSYLRRFTVKPGLTGLWQVSGRNERTYEEMVRFDIEYAESDSLLLDLRILARTVPVVLGRQGVA